MTKSTADELSRLIEDEERNQGTSRTASISTSTVAERSATPIKWRPLLVLLALNAMQPLAFEIIFPFVNQMILEIGVVTDPERVGFYSGVIESIYSCMSFIAILPCSALSDRIGRKPVILGGLLGLAVSVVCFGMSKSFLAMVFSRLLGGALGGVWACTKIVIGEMTDKSNQGVAFSAHTMSYRAGQIVGLPLGGLLAHPERNFPLFRSAFWFEYPFALPCFVAAALCLCAVTMGYFSLPETLKTKRKKPSEATTYGTIEPSSDEDLPPLSPAEAHGAESDKHTYRSILTPSIISLLLSNFTMCLVSEALFSVFPLFSFTPIASGGLGMSEAAIGIQMGVRAVMHIAMLGFFSPLQRRFGTAKVYKISMWTWPFVTLCFPLLSFMAREGKTDGWPFMALFLVLIFIWSIGGFAWTANAVMITDAAPSSAALATINGLSQMSIALPQAIAPGVVTSVFAISIKSGIAHGNLIWIGLFAITCTAAVHSLTLHDSDTDWRQK